MGRLWLRDSTLVLDADRALPLLRQLGVRWGLPADEDEETLLRYLGEELDFTGLYRDPHTEAARELNLNHIVARDHSEEEDWQDFARAIAPIVPDGQFLQFDSDGDDVRECRLVFSGGTYRRVIPTVIWPEEE